MTTDLPTSRFVILRHEVGPQLRRTRDDHLDWMFEINGVLRTWSTPPVADFDRAFQIAGQRLQDHRLAYLHLEGEIDGDRGRVTRVLQGRFQMLDESDQRLTAALFWEDQAGGRRADVEFYRILAEDRLRVDDIREDWRLRFSPCR